MKSLNQIKQSLIDNKNKLYTEYPIRSMAIFGSYARMEQTGNSDLDVMVEFSDKIGIRFIDLAEEIERITGLKVDLVSKNGLKDKYFHAIQNDLIYV